MKHIRFLTTNEQVCEKPKRLGYDTVVLEHDPNDNDTCVICRQLLMSWNLNEFQRDRVGNMPTSIVFQPDYDILEPPSKRLVALAIFDAVMIVLVSIMLGAFLAAHFHG